MQILRATVLFFLQLHHASSSFSTGRCFCRSLSQPSFRAKAYPREDDDDDRIYRDIESGAQNELRDIKYQGDRRDDTLSFYDDDEEVIEDEFFEDEDDLGDDRVPETGNFWSNPRQGMDRDLEIPRQYRRQRRPMPPSTASPARGRRSPGRTTFRSGTPPTPDALKDIYDRLFWYGMDEEDNDEWVPKSYDKTVFGGTRGKFNALSYLEDGYDVRPPPRRIKRRPSNDLQDQGSLGYEEPTYDDYDEDIDGNDPPRRRRRQDRLEPQEYASTRRNNWVSKDVQEWFREEDDYEDYVETDEDFLDDGVGYQDGGYSSARGSPRRRTRRSKPNPIVQFLDGLLDVDRNDMSFKEQMYEQKIGRRQVPRTEEPRGRPSYVYDEIDDDFDDVIDIKDDTLEVEAVNESDDGIVDVEIEKEEEPGEEKSKNRMTWEERARRLERVPPSGIPAWGPSGDLGMDARTKAMLNGMEELRDARTQVAAREERTKLARDDIVVLRADAALETKKRNINPRRARERLRQIQLDIEDAGRALRRAKKEEELSKARLSMLQDKHWAVLSLYDVNKASQEVAETLAELTVEQQINIAPEDGSGPPQQQSSPTGNSK